MSKPLSSSSDFDSIALHINVSDIAFSAASPAWPLIGAVGDKLATSAAHLFAAGAPAADHGTQTGARARAAAGRVTSRGAGAGKAPTSATAAVDLCLCWWPTHF